MFVDFAILFTNKIYIETAGKTITNELYAWFDCTVAGGTTATCGDLPQFNHALTIIQNILVTIQGFMLMFLFTFQKKTLKMWWYFITRKSMDEFAVDNNSKSVTRLTKSSKSKNSKHSATEIDLGEKTENKREHNSSSNFDEKETSVALNKQEINKQETSLNVETTTKSANEEKERTRTTTLKEITKEKNHRGKK